MVEDVDAASLGADVEVETTTVAKEAAPEKAKVGAVGVVEGEKVKIL